MRAEFADGARMCVYKAIRIPSKYSFSCHNFWLHCTIFLSFGTKYFQGRLKIEKYIARSGITSTMYTCKCTFLHHTIHLHCITSFHKERLSSYRVTHCRWRSGTCQIMSDTWAGTWKLPENYLQIPCKKRIFCHFIALVEAKGLHWNPVFKRHSLYTMCCSNWNQINI